MITPLTETCSEEVKANRLKVIEALESGKYKKTERVFCNRAEDCYCSWGVIFDTFGGLNKRGIIVDLETKGEDKSVFEVLDQVFRRLGMNNNNPEHYDVLYTQLTRLNDAPNSTFEVTSQYLRFLWSLPKE